MSHTRLNRAIAVLSFVLFALAAPLAQANEGAAKPAKEGPVYVDFKSIVVPVMKKNGTMGVVALNVMAEVPDDEAKAQVKDYLPKLRDAFIRALYGNMETSKFLRADGALDIERIRHKLLASAQYVMKEKDNPITDILFQNIAQQTY